MRKKTPSQNLLKLGLFVLVLALAAYAYSLSQTNNLGTAGPGSQKPVIIGSGNYTKPGDIQGNKAPKSGTSASDLQKAVPEKPTGLEGVNPSNASL